MEKCCIKGCDTDAQYKSETFFSFPKSNADHNTWVANIGPENIMSSPNARICSKHFTSDSVVECMGMKHLKEDAVPTIFPYILTATEICKTKKPKTIKEEPGKSLALIIDAGVCKGVLAKQNSTEKADPDISRQPSTKNKSLQNDILKCKPKEVTLKRHLSSTTKQVEKFKNPLKPNILSPTALRIEKINRLTKQVSLQKNKIAALIKQTNRLKRKVVTFKNVINELKKHSEMSKEHAMLLQESQKFLTRQVTKWAKQKKV